MSLLVERAAGSLTVTEGNLGWMVRSVGAVYLHRCGPLILPVRLAAMSDFAKKQSDWYSTWPQGSQIDDRAFIV
jgi:hypothetical protein